MKRSMTKSGVPWADWAWNPVEGCSPISAGCERCYAASFAHRFGRPWGTPVFHPEKLEEPYNTKRPGRVFVCSTSDIFHKDVDTGAIVAILDVIHNCPQHTFMILTKRPKRLMEEQLMFPGDITQPMHEWFHMPNIWLGVTAENQARFDERWAIIQKIPAAVRFVSVEPMLEPVTIMRSGVIDHPVRLPDWVICGPENGPKTRPCNPEWIDALSAESDCFFDKRADGTRKEFPQ